MGSVHRHHPRRPDGAGPDQHHVGMTMQRPNFMITTMRRFRAVWARCVLMWASLYVCPQALGQANDGSILSSIASEFSDVERARILQHSPLLPLPPDTSNCADDPRAARLGQFLFFDRRL